jgi:hypothetical protein
MAKAKKTKTIPLKQDAGDAPTFKQTARRFVLNVLAVAVMVGGACAGLYYMRKHVERDLTFPDRPPAVVLKNQPAWMSPLLVEQIVASVRPLGTHSSFDHQLLQDRVRVLSGNPWIKRVNQVRRVYGKAPGDTLEIDCDYRVPVALVAWEDYYWLVDGEAVKLPEQYTAEQLGRIITGSDGRLNIRVITGVRHPPVESGRTWPGEDLASALALVKVLHGRTYAEEIVRVDVSNFAGRRSIKDAQIVLGTKYNTEIRWGQPVNPRDFFIEVPASRKLERLAQIKAQYGRVDANQPWIDIRFETVTHPVPDARSAGAN